MDKQQEQMKQKPNQEIEYTSGFLNEDEEVKESYFDEPVEEPQKADESAGNKQNKPEGEKQPKRPKRSRKTIEQEIAELDEKRQKLMEKKRRQEAHEKIIFGGTVIAVLKNMKSNSDNQYSKFCDKIIEFTTNNKSVDKDIIKKIINLIKDTHD